MRRKISLYIANRMVDLEDQSLILFNYTMEDLMNPTIVKNSYSHQITLKGTPNNNQVFGDIFRLDRRVTSFGGVIGTDFNPSQKTPFVIYNEMNEILESGYCKLDNVSRSRGNVEYHISLFGGLGSFLYSLAYDAEGNKRTLADLAYLDENNKESELDFVINASNVASAWETETSEGDIDSIWKVINFAPAYNGIPEGEFSADKALVTPSLVGLQNTIGAYTTRNGYALVNFAQAHDEWAVKDLRSYLQRPVLSMRAFLEAIKKPFNNGGYVVNMPFLEKTGFANYARLWMTLRMIPSIGTIRKESGDLSLTLSSSATSSTTIARYTIGGSVPFGTKVSTNVNVRLQYSVAGATEATLTKAVTNVSGRTTYGKQSVVFMQLVAFASDDTIVGGSKVKCLSSWQSSPAEMATRCEYTPSYQGEDSYESVCVKNNTFNKVGDIYRYAEDLGFTCEAQDVAYYELHVATYDITTEESTGGTTGSRKREIRSVIATDSCLCTMYKDYNTALTPTLGIIVNGAAGNTISYSSAETLRSGSTITKAMLLSTEQTPADYLLSFCKMFGLHILIDKASQEVTIIDRDDLYEDEVIDLTKRVDTSKDIQINPFVFKSKWYDFVSEGAGGAFLEEYKKSHGRDYGMQRINTGYDFDANITNMMEGNVFKNAATILDRSPYYTIIRFNGHFYPSVFVDKGNTFTLWNATTGETLDTEISNPPYSASLAYYNEDGHPGSDIEFARKVELRTADNKPIDGENVLLFLEGFNTYDYFNLSDDIPAMGVLNDGVPCWILNPGSADGLRIPIFQRYTYTGGGWTIQRSLDFGVPEEMNIPQITYKEDSTIYARFWRNYLRDRYDVNTKVMTCRVNFGGFQIGNDLLRKFYWYNNALWTLNRITNYSLTTFDPVECEFVQVQDKDNYLNGLL